MIPILYDSTETKYTTNGLGRLPDALSCVVEEERNGLYELTMQYPVKGRHYKDIRNTRKILAIPSDGAEPQPFEIYKISKPMSGRVTVQARHVSYQLSYVPVAPFTAVNVSDALDGLKSHSAEANPFTFWTDKGTEANFTVSAPISLRKVLGGMGGSILDVYGGELEFDRYTVKLHAARGADNGVTLLYGKNITDIKQEESIESTYTGVFPYWSSSDGELVMLPEKVLHSDNAANFPYQRTIVLDLSSNWQEAPTEDQLRAAARSYMKANNIGVPSVNLTVSFVALWQTKEYKDVAPLERVHLCDTVHVYFPKLDVSASSKVVKTTWNVLKDRYDSIKLGTISASLAGTIAEQSTALEDSEKKNDARARGLQKAIENATEKITGIYSRSGVIQTHYNDDDEAYEQTIADNKDLSQAKKVWRWNLGGLGFSATGYNGPYTTAITQDGHIVADFIDTGTLDASKATITNINASNITTGTLKGDRLDDHGVPVIKLDGSIANGNWKLDFRNGTFTIGNISATNITTGTLDASKATITNINASNINTGTLNGSLVTVTNLNASNITAGTIKNVKNNNSYWNLDTGEFKTTNGKFVDADISGIFYSQNPSTKTYVQIDNGVIAGGPNYENGRIEFDHTIHEDNGETYKAMALIGGDIVLRGNLWTIASGERNGDIFQGSDGVINVVNAIHWHVTYSSNIPWVEGLTKTTYGKIIFKNGLFIRFEQTAVDQYVKYYKER